MLFRSPLNIGFDKNTNHHDALYYDNGNGWTQSSVVGSIMINPLMGCVDIPVPVGINDYKQPLTDFNVYPNPAQNNLTVRLSELSLENITLTIYSTLGEQVLSKPFINAESIDISALPNGVYLIYLNGERKNRSPKKLVISR